jgi:LacI family transcriptional regulator, galactose operon repressor
MDRTGTRLKDIADATGFSANTVSLALRDSPRIAKQTRDLIIAEAQRRNYLPNQVARSLVSRATKTIGLVLTDIMNPTLTLSARSVERRLEASGYSVMFAASDNVAAAERKAIDVFRSRQVDGMLIYPTSHRELAHIRPLARSGYPIVLLIADASFDINAVGIDDRRGAYKAASHLLALGHRRVALIDAARPLGNFEKYEGYVAAHRDHGVTVDEANVIHPIDHGASGGYEAQDRLMQRNPAPTAVIGSNDRIAIGALGWCRDRGVRVPQDLAVVGYDNIEAAQYTSVPLTSVNYAADTVADLAVERLLTLIADPDKAKDPEVTLIVPELVVRESCGAGLAGHKPD